MQPEEENKTAQTVENEGEKVSGGAGGTSESTATEESGGAAAPDQGGELMPEGESKKEEIDGYNEHPDQAKVGGG